MDKDFKFSSSKLLLFITFISFLIFLITKYKPKKLNNSKNVRFSKIKKERYFDVKTREILGDVVGQT